MSELRNRIRTAYADTVCPHRFITERPCGDCVTDAICAAIGAPADGQWERVSRLERRLIESEVARRAAARGRNPALRNSLANLSRLDIGQAAVNDLQALVARWMLRLGRIEDERRRPR